MRVSKPLWGVVHGQIRKYMNYLSIVLGLLAIKR